MPAVETVLYTVAGLLAAIGAVFGFRAWQRSRITPEERERRRRSALAARGKMADATLLDIRDQLLLYSYGVRGVEYTASQDISALRQFLPADLSIFGPVVVKYDPRNPGNSIMLAEDWSGLRVSRAG